MDNDADGIIDEESVLCFPPENSGLRPYLWGLRLDFSGTRERAMDFTHDCG